MFFFYTNNSKETVCQETLTFKIMDNLKKVDYDENGKCEMSDDKEY